MNTIGVEENTFKEKVLSMVATMELDPQMTHEKHSNTTSIIVWRTEEFADAHNIVMEVLIVPGKEITYNEVEGKSITIP